MRLTLLVDANLSPSLTRDLIAAGYEAVHVADVGLLRSSDEEIFDWCASRDRVDVTADSDFPMLLALRRAESPSVVFVAAGARQHSCVRGVRSGLLVRQMTAPQVRLRPV